jgi:peptidoglycan/LPS O-acetylase OafA/YrhL
MRPQHADRWDTLDGVRAAAVTSVLLYHLFIAHFFTAGYLGVDIFFVLSGFLITTLLLREHDRDGKVALGRFYGRRALRLFPALAAVMAFAAILALLSLREPLAHQTLTGLPWIALYVGNWARATGAASLGLMAHAWSLAVEEQFYILWPAALLAILRIKVRRERTALFLLAVALAETAYRETLFHHGYSVSRLAFGLDTHSDGLLVGCALAFWMASGQARTVGPMYSRVAASLGCVAIIAMVLTGNAQTSFQYEYPLTALATGAILWNLLTYPLRALAAGLRSRPALWLGRRSYGLYLWSYPIFYGLPWPHSMSTPVRDISEIAASLVVCGLSYRFIEQPFLRLKDRRLSSTPRRSDDGPTHSVQPVVPTPTTT